MQDSATSPKIEWQLDAVMIQLAITFFCTVSVRNVHNCVAFREKNAQLLLPTSMPQDSPQRREHHDFAFDGMNFFAQVAFC